LLYFDNTNLPHHTKVSIMSGKDTSLYGAARPRKLKGSEISASNSISFTSQLSSLIATASTQRGRPAAGASAARAKKDDIFTTHNKNAKKRALKDLEDRDDAGDGLAQKHSTSGGGVDDETWRRSKRRLEDKARLYAAMKRGEVEDADERYAVDFDRKWAEARERGEGDGGEDDEEEDDDDDGDDEEIEYVDEFGRTRRGTRAEAAREERRQRQQHDLAAEPDRFSARPRMPAQVIYGDTVQAAAFDPGRAAAERMAELAAKRDRPATPPPDEHFDSRREIRTKGVGFFQFSGDGDERKRQMEELERERAETERVRAEAVGRREERRKEVEARKKTIAEKRGKARADRFLDGLLGEVADKIGGDEPAPEPEEP
jgi:hypothetical protein